MLKKPLLKKKDVKKPQTVIINPDLDEKGSPVVEGILSKTAYNIGYLTGKAIRAIGKEFKDEALSVKPKKKRLKEARKPRRWIPRDPWKPDTPLSDSEKATRQKKADAQSKANDRRWAKGHREWAAKEAMKEDVLDELSATKLKDYVNATGHPHKRPESSRKYPAIALKKITLKKKNISEETEQKSKAYHIAVVKHHSHAARALAKSQYKGGTNMHVFHKLQMKKHQELAKTAIESFEPLQEISKRTAKLYFLKAKNEVSPGPEDTTNDAHRKSQMKGRIRGLKLVDKKLHGGAKVMAKEEVELTELSANKLGKYITKAKQDLRTGPVSATDKTKKPEWQGRVKGISLAAQKINDKKHEIRGEETIHELYGKGSIDTIGKHHAANSSKGKPNSKYHAIQRNRAARVRDIHKGTGPLGKTTWKGRAEYARQDRAEAKKLKEAHETAVSYKIHHSLEKVKPSIEKLKKQGHKVIGTGSVSTSPTGAGNESRYIIRYKKLKEAMGWNIFNKDRAKEMTPDEHIEKIKHHSKQARKYGQNSHMGQLHVRAAARHVHYFATKDKTREGALKAMDSLREGNISKETLKQRADTTNYIDRRDDEIIRRRKQGHSHEKIAKDMKLHPGVVSAAIGVMKEDQLTELSRDTLQNYQHTASNSYRQAKKNRNVARTKGKNALADKHRKTVSKRTSGLNMAHAKLTGAKVLASEEFVSEAKRGRPRKVQDAESNEHINMQLRKSISLRGQNHVAFGDGTKHQISPTLAHKALHMHDTMRTSIEKGEFAKRLAHSHNSFMDAVAGKPADAAKPKITLGAGFGAKHIKK